MYDASNIVLANCLWSLQRHCTARRRYIVAHAFDIRRVDEVDMRGAKRHQRRAHCVRRVLSSARALESASKCMKSTMTTVGLVAYSVDQLHPFHFHRASMGDTFKVHSLLSNYCHHRRPPETYAQAHAR